MLVALQNRGVQAVGKGRGRNVHAHGQSGRAPHRAGGAASGTGGVPRLLPTVAARPAHAPEHLAPHARTIFARGAPALFQERELS